jgi:drug/metabolite transporter (DMT)-like permease
MGATTYLVPPLAVLICWAFLGETPPALALAGGALCLVGVAVTRAQPSARGMRTSIAPAGGSSPGA